MGRHEILKSVLLCAIFALGISIHHQVVVECLYPDDYLMWEHIAASVPEMTIPDAPAGAVLPHHAITSCDVARFYKGLKSKINPDTFSSSVPIIMNADRLMC